MITRSAIASARSTRCSREHDGAARLLDRGEERLGAGRVELRRRLVEQQQLAARARAPRRGRRAAARRPRARPCVAPRGAPPRPRRAPASTRGQISSGATPRFSSPNATSFSTRVITTWSSGSWKTEATVPASSAGPCERVSSPPTSTRPEKRPPWKCGTRPASARSSVDLPLPDGPSSATTSPAWSSSETSRTAGAPPG